MKNLQKIRSFLRALAGSLAAMACVTAAYAHPFASGITNNSGTISYILNEAATTVSIVLTNNGKGQGTTIAGGTARGVNSFSLTQSSVTYSNYAIIVQKNGTGTFAPTGPDFQVDLFNGPRGVAVNMNPQTHNFGRIYVVNASPGTASPVPAGDTTRTMGKGVFVLNADGSDCLNYGGTAYPVTWQPSQTNVNTYPNTGWGTSATYSPYRVFVGPDDAVYVGDSSYYTSSYNCGSPLWLMSPDLTNPTNLFPLIDAAGGANSAAANAGPCQSRPFITGSLANGNLMLTVVEWNETGLTSGSPGDYNYMLQYAFPDTTTTTLPDSTVTPATLGASDTTPTLSYGIPFADGPGVGIPTVDGVASDIYQGPLSGEWYCVEERGTSGSGNVNSMIFDVTGNSCLWTGASINGGFDPWTSSYGVAVSPDEKYMVTSDASGLIRVCAITNNGTVWLPDFSTLVTNNTGLNGSARGIAFDLADNVYFVTGGDCVMRSYTLGLTSTCTTSNDYTTANGRFAFTTPGTTVTIVADTNAAYKNQMLSTGSGNSGPSSGDFKITRSGGSIASALTVTVSIGGTAVNGSDYSLSPAVTTTVTIPALASSTNVVVTPIHNGIPEPTTTVIMNVVGGVGYGTQSPNNTATVTISDDNTPTMQIASAIFTNPIPGVTGTLNMSTMYEPNQYDYCVYAAARLGNTNTNAFTVNIAYSGTASPSDYNGATTVTVNPGDTVDYVTNYAMGRVISSGSNSVVATVTSGTGYNVAGTGFAATNWIIYDEVPAGKVLFFDNFTTSTTNGGSSANSNYTVLYGAADIATETNNFELIMPFDYSTIGVPPAPHTTDASTLGVFMCADNPNNGAAAGMNLYPELATFPGVHVSAFSNSFAMRVDMFLIENGGTSIAGTTEYALFGVGHSGLDTNWFDNSSVLGPPTGASYDGLWYEVEDDGASLGDYVLESAPQVTPGTQNDPTSYVAQTAFNLYGVFKANPWTVGTDYGGAPANQWPLDGSGTFSGKTPSWATVEIDQVISKTATNVSLKINNWPIMNYTITNVATALFTAGNVMIGHDDAYNGNGTTGAGVIYDNLTVVQLSLDITKISVASGTVTITFTWGLDEAASVFALQTSSSAVAPFSDNAGATIVRTGVGTYTATIATNGAVQFYQVRHK